MQCEKYAIIFSSMKKLHFVPVLFLTLVSCKSENAIPLINDYDFVASGTTNLIDITVDEFINKMNHKDSFAFLYHSETCSSCKVAYQTISAYVQENHYTIYGLSNTLYTKEILEEKYPKVFKDRSNPQLMLFNKGELTYSHGYSNLEKLDNFKTKNKNRVKQTEIYTLTSENAYKDYVEKNENTFVFIYDQWNEDQYNTYVNTYFQIASKSSKQSLVIEKSRINDGLISYFSQNYLVNITTQSFALKIKRGRLDALVDYSVNEEAFTNLLNAYFQ